MECFRGMGGGGGRRVKCLKGSSVECKGIVEASNDFGLYVPVPVGEVGLVGAVQGR